MNWEEAKQYLSQGKTVRRADYASGKFIAFVDTNYYMDGQIWWPINEDAMAWDWELSDVKKSAKKDRVSDAKDAAEVQTVDTQEAGQLESSIAATFAAKLQNPLPQAGSELTTPTESVDPKIQKKREASLEKSKEIVEEKKAGQDPKGA